MDLSLAATCQGSFRSVAWPRQYDTVQSQSSMFYQHVKQLG